MKLPSREGSDFEWSYLHNEGDSFRTRKMVFFHNHHSLSFANNYLTSSDQTHIHTKIFNHLPSQTHRSRLSLRNQIPPQHSGLNGPLLDGTRLLETVGVDTTKKLVMEAHVLELAESLNLFALLEYRGRLYELIEAFRHTSKRLPVPFRKDHV